MEKRRFLTTILAVCMLLALAVPAFALEYTFDEDEQSGYGKPTSVDLVVTADGGAQKNEDVSKNAAIIPPGFGTPTSNTLNTGEYLTPNLVPGALSGGLVNQVGSAGANATGGVSGSSVIPGEYPSVNGGSSITMSQIPGSSPTDIAQGNTNGGYTEVTDDLYYSDGSLGTLKIPAIGLTVDIFEGTDAATLKRGAGHFEDTSIWDGNVGFAAHNRGANSYFGKIHTLELGDRITLTTRLGTRTYEVTSVSKVSETDRSALAASQSNVITLYTCVRDERDFRWCVTGAEIV